MDRYNDAYLELANAIIYKASDDYLHFNREYYRLERKCIKEKNNPTVFVKKDGESQRIFNQRRKRNSTPKFREHMENCKTIVKAIRVFFQGEYIKSLSDVDGNKILEELDKILEKEGHKIWDLQ